MATNRNARPDPRDDRRGDAGEDMSEALPDAERARAQARARSGDPDASEMGTAATARPTADTHGATPAEREAEFQRTRQNPDEDEETTGDVRGAYDRYTSGELLDGSQVHNEPPGRTE